MAVLPNTSLCSNTGILFRHSVPLSLCQFTLSQQTHVSLLHWVSLVCYIYPLAGDPYNFRSYRHAVHNVCIANLTSLSIQNPQPYLRICPQQQVHKGRLLGLYLDTQKPTKIWTMSSAFTNQCLQLEDNMTVKLKCYAVICSYQFQFSSLASPC
jgi:hypothetical protein